MDCVKTTPAAAFLTINTDPLLLKTVLAGYHSDPFCIKLLNSSESVPSLTERDGLLYIGDRLVVPHVGTLHEDLFWLTHDSLGHFGFDKLYATLRHTYYWPNMRWDLQEAYIPACVDCQCNKSPTTKHAGPLHPLPIPDTRSNSIVIDFIGPLPVDDGFDCIVTITDRLSANIRIAATHTDITAEHFAAQFFDLWYCKNGLPLNIISDCDKLFVSQFWKALHALTGVKLKMSSVYHPETDGSSERTNKMVEQALHYHVDRHQKGWAKALPIVRFNICMMNTVNASTGFLPFQLRMGRSLHVIPPFTSSDVVTQEQELTEAACAIALLESLAQDTAEAKDNLLKAKVAQAECANRHRGPEVTFKAGDKVQLSTEHCWCEYMQAKSGRVTKLMPCSDGLFTVIHAHPETSNYTIELRNEPNRFHTFHASQLRPFCSNDDELFPSCTLPQPGTVVTTCGQEEWLIRDIIDE